MQFAPRQRWAYNNSGYCLLGAIIEKISGLSYAQFVQQRIFEPLGMRQSYYDEAARIIPKRAAGYQKGSDGFANAEYLSMTQPYAAGALTSTVDDLARWDAALTRGRLLRPATLERAWTPYRLADGSPTDYGYGWRLSSWQGRQTAEHSGGIHGFTAYALRIPADDVFVAVLSNHPGGPSTELLALKIAALLIGQPYTEPVSIALAAEELAPYVGEYQSAAGVRSIVTCEGDRLFIQAADQPRAALVPVSRIAFHLDGMPLAQLVFTFSPGHAVAGFEWRSRSGVPEAAERVDAPPSHE